MSQEGENKRKVKIEKQEKIMGKTRKTRPKGKKGEEGRGKREEGRGKREEGRGKREERGERERGKALAGHNTMYFDPLTQATHI